MVSDFNLDDFSGQWFPIYHSPRTKEVTGRCPVSYIDRRAAISPAQQKRLDKISVNAEPFVIQSSYKGDALVTDNHQEFKGYFDKGSSNGSLWIGATLKPLKKFVDNFQVVSTDYDNYAILYTCTFKTAMYDHDSITVLSRNSPSIEEIP